MMNRIRTLFFDTHIPLWPVLVLVVLFVLTVFGVGDLRRKASSLFLPTRIPLPVGSPNSRVNRHALLVNGAKEDKDSPAFVRTTEHHLSDILYSELGLSVLVLEFQGPVDSKATFWVETYENGGLNKELSWSISKTPEKGNRAKGLVLFSRREPDMLSNAKSMGGRWQLAFAGTRSAKWIDDPFEKFEGYLRIPNEGSWDVEIGNTYTLQTLVASRSGRHRIDIEKELDTITKNDLLVYIKCRFDLVDTDRRTAVVEISDSIPEIR